MEVVAIVTVCEVVVIIVVVVGLVVVVVVVMTVVVVVIVAVISPLINKSVSHNSFCLPETNDMKLLFAVSGQFYTK